MKKDIIIDKENSVSIKACGDKLELVRNTETTKTGARIFQNGKILSSSFVGNIKDEEIIKLAQDNPETAVPYEYDLIDPKAVNESHISPHFNKKEFLEEFRKVASDLSKKFPQFILKGQAELSTTSRRLKHVDSSVEQYVENNGCNWIFMYRHQNSKGLMDGYFAFEQKDRFTHKEEIEAYSEVLESFENNVKLTSKRYPVVFIDPYMGSLVTKIYESASIRSYRQEVGVFKGQLGAEILSPKFSMYDVSFDPERMIFSPFDGEGFVRENPRFPIVENGVFKNLYADCRWGHKYDLATTGNGKRSYNTEINLSPHSTLIAAGQRSYKEILADLPECIAIEVSAGDNFSEPGEYSAPVQNAYFYKNGKLQGRCPQLTVVTHIKKMFGEDLIEIASDSFISKKANPAIFMEADVMIHS